MNSYDFEKLEIAEDKLKKYYEMREQVGKGEVLGKEELSIERTEEDKANSSLIEANKLKKEADAILNEIGASITPETGEIKFDSSRTVSDESKEKIGKIQTSLSEVSQNYTSSTNVLYGDGNLERTSQAQATASNPGVKQQIIERKQEQVKRDVSAKKLLKERAELEAIKDAMDMDAATHVARKNRILIRMEQLKLEIAQKLSRGSNPNDMSVQVCQVELQGLANEISKLENEFSVRRDSYMSQFEGARTALDNSQKTIMLERENARENRQNGRNIIHSNGYVRNLTYSDDGILNGSETEGNRDDRSLEEKEIFDERGVMIFDVADVISRTKSINIDGTQVRCVTEFEGHNVEDTYYIGNDERLNVGSSGNQNIIEEEPDIEKEVHETATGRPTSINIFESAVQNMRYEIDDVAYSIDGLSAVEMAKRVAVAKGLIMLGLNRENNTMSPEGLDFIRDKIVEIAREKAKEEEIEEDPYSEIPPPKYT